MSLQGKTVLVTGAGGFIGSHLTHRLVGLGADVRAFVRYNSRNDWGLLELLPSHILGEVGVFLGDLRDPDAVRRAADGTHTIFHLGSLIGIPYSYMSPRETVETNIMGTLNVLTAAQQFNVERVVHTSTSEVYGTAAYVPIDETHPLKGQSPYAASKIGADTIAASFYRTYGLPVSTIRPFNTYGPRQSGRAVIPTVVTQALVQDSVYLGSVHTTRDYTYVEDLVEAFLKISESKKSVGQVINVGSNCEVSIGDLARKIIDLMERDATIIMDKSRFRPEDSEVERLRCNNGKAKQLLNWTPSTSLTEGLKATITWISEHLDLYKPHLYVV